MVTRIAIGSIGIAVGGVAHAQLVSGFELPNFTGSAGGTSFVGVEGWYQPVATGIEESVYTYAGNTLGLVQNPVGGNQFIGGSSQGGTLFARAQKNFDFGSGVHTMAYDMAGNFNGTAPSAINLSSVSLTSEFGAAGSFKSFIALNNFVDLANPAAGFKAEFNVFDSTGAATNNLSPGAAWQNLDTNHWYRQFIDFDFGSNRILSVTILDLTTGMSSTANPDGWYMTGGAASALDLPDSFRFFIGGAAGNTMGWDNINVVPAPASLLAFAGMAGLAGARRRR
jgi:hypothetical protein